MRIACADKTAAARLELVRLIEQAFESCRASLALAEAPNIVPISREELGFQEQIDILLLGPALSVEEAVTIARGQRGRESAPVVFALLSQENYNLRSLRRFEDLDVECFVVGELPVRFVHKCAQSRVAQVKRLAGGRLIAVHGAKGGVGSTSIVSGLAHAASAIGKSAIIVDFSSQSALAHYLGAIRWQSPEYAAALTDGHFPEEGFLDKCIVVAPNGVSLLLAPAGGLETRELWLRDENRFELSLAIIAKLQETFDAVIVDLAGIEGVLGYAVTVKSHLSLLVTSNDPASIHLTAKRLRALAETPHEGDLKVIVNLLWSSGLGKDDVIDFLELEEDFSREMGALPAIGYDSRARSWIGSGNTFYTSAGSATKRTLETIMQYALDGTSPLEPRLAGPWRRLVDRISRAKLRRQVRADKAASQPLLPFAERPAARLVAPQPPPTETPQPAAEEQPVFLYEPPVPVSLPNGKANHS